MANRTDPRALSVHGTNPQNLLEQIVRMRIYSCAYWKEHCFGLTAETLVDKAMELDHYGGTYGGNKKPSKFLCLILKMLQIQPERDIVLEFILNEDYKYVRLLGAFYLRLVGKAKDIYQYLEPLYNDYRKIRKKSDLGWQYSHVDEFIDELLTAEYCLDVVLPRIQKRAVLEEAEELPARKSGLELELEDEDSESDSGEDGEILESKKEKERDKDKEKEKEKEKEREKKIEIMIKIKIDHDLMIRIGIIAIAIEMVETEEIDLVVDHTHESVTKIEIESAEKTGIEIRTRKKIGNEILVIMTRIMNENIKKITQMKMFA